MFLERGAPTIPKVFIVLINFSYMSIRIRGLRNGKDI